MKYHRLDNLIPNLETCNVLVCKTEAANKVWFCLGQTLQEKDPFMSTLLFPSNLKYCLIKTR